MYPRCSHWFPEALAPSVNLPTTVVKEEEVTEGEGDNAIKRIKCSKADTPITAARIWTHLQDKFEKKNGVSAAFDYQKFIRMGFVDNGNIHEQIEAHMAVVLTTILTILGENLRIVNFISP